MLKKFTRWLERERERERERVIVYTQVANDSSIKLLPEFVFKGKGTRPKVNASENMHYQWASKGYYLLEQMLKTISHLPNRFNMLMPKNYEIYVLDDDDYRQVHAHTHLQRPVALYKDITSFH